MPLSHEMARSDRPARRRGPYRLRSNHAAAGLDRPTDLAFAEDGRIFIAERAGRVRVVRDGRPPRRRCPWHDERTGRPGSAFDVAQARKDPGLHQWEGLQVLGSDARCRGLAAWRPAASFYTPEEEPGASARSWPRPDQHLLSQGLHGRRQVESDKPGQHGEPRLHRQRKETRLALDDVETVRTKEVADAAV